MGLRRSVSRVPGAEPRTSPPATAPVSYKTTVQPVGLRESVKCPTLIPSTSVIQLIATSMLNSTRVKARIQENVPLAPLTTFGIGGPARYFINAPSETAVLEALDFATSQNVPIFVLGGGSNILVADEGFPGLVLKIDLMGIRCDDDRYETIVRAGAGEEWDRLVQTCAARALAGIECLSGIPGSVGGTPVQNVGAY